MTFWHMSRAIGRPKPPHTTSPRKSSSTKSKPHSWKPSFSSSLEAVDDAAPAAAAADLGAAELHGEHAVALEADVADAHRLAGELPLRRRLDDRRAARPPNSSDVVSLFGSQPMSSTFLPCCAIMYDRLASVKLLPMPPLP